MNWIQIAKRMTKINGAPLKIDEMKKNQMIARVKAGTKSSNNILKESIASAQATHPISAARECDKMYS